MTVRDDDLRVRPGRIQHGNLAAKRPKTFVGEVLRAAKRGGQPGKTFNGTGARKERLPFAGRRRVALSCRRNHRGAGSPTSWGGSCVVCAKLSSPPKANALPATIGGE